MKVKILILTLAFVFLTTYLQAQCAMCKAVVEANLESGGTKGAGLNDGILYLMAMPYVGILFFAIVYYLQSKKTKKA